MPYVITTTTPDPANAVDYGHYGDPVPNAPTAMSAVRGCWPPKVTRTAVATLDEVRAIVRAELTARSPKHATPTAMEVIHEQADDIFAHDGTGSGTIGPLPDDTVIEVRYRAHAVMCPQAEHRANRCGSKLDTSHITNR